LSEEERLECFKRFIEFSSSRVKISARWFLVSHVQWNRWCKIFNAPPIPPPAIPSFYRWLLKLCRRAGLHKGEDYRRAFRQRHHSKRVKGILIRREALSKLLSLAPIAGVQPAAQRLGG
jgi:hypothetical protein